MKSLTVLFVSFFCLTSFIDSPVAQVIWTKDTLNNPVLSPGDPGEWEAGAIQVDAVIFDDTTYHIWYTGGFSLTPSIGYATSPDGIHWDKDTVNNPVFTVGEPGQWDDDVVASVSILFRDNTFHMWYTGGGNGQIGYATSPDGINWTRNPNNPVLSPGAPGSWDDQAVQQSFVLLDGDTLRMWYHGTQNFYNFSIGYATSVDGVVWAKNASNPVLEVGSQGEWDSRWTISPFVIKKDGMFQMWYSGNDGQISHFGYATSPDGIHWTKDTLNNPVLSPGEPGEWDADGIGSPTLLFNDPTYHMWYFGRYNNILRIGHAASLPSTIIRVPQDQPSIQAGIDAAADGNTVLVADGTYLENINFKGKAITVASHYIMDGDTNHIANTIIDGSQPNNPDSGSVVNFISGEDTTSVLHGLTITGGTGTNIDTMTIGGGVLLYHSGGKIVNCRITDNTIQGVNLLLGGGICTFSDMAPNTTVIRNCRIDSNLVSGTSGHTAGGGLYIGSMAIIEGNVIRANESRREGSDLHAATGGGIYAGAYIQNLNVNISNNQIVDNLTTGIGGYGAYSAGMDLYDVSFSVNNNIFSNNIVSSNVAGYGPGSRVVYGSGTISGNSFLFNRSINTPIVNGGGMLLAGAQNLRITDNYFEGNEATGGGGMLVYESSPELQNNLIKGNTATADGGGLYILGSPPLAENINSSDIEAFSNKIYGALTNSEQLKHTQRSNNRSNLWEFADVPTIINNTIVGNTASSRGGSIYSESSQGVVLNSILYGNDAPNGPEIYLNGSIITVGYSDVQGGWAGDGNIDADPFFANTADYQLSDSSACLAAGIDSINIGGIWYYAPPTDMGGNPRPNPAGSMPDMGAWESPFAIPVGILSNYSEELPKTYSLQQSYPNPFNPSTTIAYQVPRQSYVRIDIYNTLGQRVRTLLNDRKEPGSYQAVWEGKNDSGAQVGSGVYLYRMVAGDFVQVRKMILMR